MAVWIEGGCRVASLREGAPRRRDGVAVWRHAGRELGSTAISLRIVEVAAGSEARFGDDSCDEVLYVLEGAGAARAGGREAMAGPDTGLYVAAGQRLTLRNPGPGPFVLATAQCPDPGADREMPPLDPPEAGATPLLVRLADVEPETTADRWYRVVIGERQGSERVTQFVGGIPPGRAPDHFHHYEEILVILSGCGRMWAGPTQAPMAAGSCVFLPRGQLHCLENTGTGELRLLGVFYPAGSPAVRYPAGTARN